MSANITQIVSTTDQAAHLDTSEILFSRILVATDFSDPANQALRVGITLSQLFGARLSLVHASVPTDYGIETGPVPVEVLNANLVADKEQMNQLVHSEPGLSALAPKVVVAYGDAIDLINQVSKEERADLIVVGSHGASGLEQLVLGSVAEAVMYQATCPVLIVGPNCKQIKHPFRSLLFATDLKTTGLRSAQYASGLAERFHAKLTLLHVLSPDFERTNERDLIRDRILQNLAKLLPSDIEQYCKAKILLEYGKPAEVIASIAQAECSSMIVVGLRDGIIANHATWSTLSYVIREANCPILGVRGHFV